MSELLDTETKINILLIDDDDEARYLNETEIKMMFGVHRQSTLRFSHAGNIKDALAVAGRDSFHLILLDHQLGHDQNKNPVLGIDYADKISELQSSAKILILTTYNDDVRLAADYMAKESVVGFLTKGETDEEINYRTTMIQKALNESLLRIEKDRQKYLKNSKLTIHRYKSAAMKQIFRKLESLAKVNLPVLIVGEPGSGKTHLAEQLNEMTRLHNNQKKRVFVDQNMGAITKSLAEAELFGAEAGSYTGANKRRIGLFELANDGTFFLDEIGEAEPEIQVKILKTVEENTVRRVGGQENIYVNARLVFATNQDLKKRIEEGLFRQDLYDRISTFVIEMPKLKNRIEDIPLICEDICEKIKKENSINIQYSDFPDDLKAFLSSGDIEGNVRGLYKKLLVLAVDSDKYSSGKINYSNWKKVLRHGKRRRAVEKSPEDLDYETIINNISKLIVNKDDHSLSKIKDEIEYRTLELIQKSKNEMKCRDVAKIIGASRSNAHSKIKKFESRQKESK